VHGGGVTREEGGFFTRLAVGLAEAGIASLRFNLRGHGESEGRQEDLTIAGILGDVRAAIAFVRSQSGADRVALLGASSAAASAVTTQPSTRLSWPAWSCSTRCSTTESALSTTNPTGTMGTSARRPVANYWSRASWSTRQRSSLADRSY
jgi:alpha/beta superfamily hydrolase